MKTSLGSYLSNKVNQMIVRCLKRILHSQTRAGKDFKFSILSPIEISEVKFLNEMNRNHQKTQLFNFSIAIKKFWGPKTKNAPSKSFQYILKTSQKNFGVNRMIIATGGLQKPSPPWNRTFGVRIFICFHCTSQTPRSPTQKHCLGLFFRKSIIYK